MKKPATNPRSAAAAGAKRNAQPGVARPKDAAAALARLKEGNARFISGKLRHAHQAAACAST